MFIETNDPIRMKLISTAFPLILSWIYILSILNIVVERFKSVACAQCKHAPLIRGNDSPEAFVSGLNSLKIQK